MNNTKDPPWNYYSIAFYNVENLFDTLNDPAINDDDFTPTGRLQWNTKRFDKKIYNISYIIRQLGLQEIGFSPVLIGIAEIENKEVLNALIRSENLKHLNYGYIHYNSQDERGIDTALLYRKDYFKVISSEKYPFYFEDTLGNKDYTRDILYVHGMLQDQEVHILINHWPSRLEGVEITEPKRLQVSAKNTVIISSIRSKDPHARILIMGDFIDNPEDKSIQQLTRYNFYNPMEQLLTNNQGSTTHKGSWNLFDQLLLSQNFLQLHGNNFRFESAHIFNKKDAQVFTGPYKGHPFRSYVGPNYLGGISDHFPVYGIFKIKNTILEK